MRHERLAWRARARPAHEAVTARASVVIPALDSEATIGAAVRSLLAQRPGLDVLVVDDGSRDGTARVATEAGARVVKLPERGGPARARNAGLRATEGELVVFTDADCEAGPGFLDALLEPLERDPAITGTKGAYVTSQRSLTARFVQLEYEERYARMARRATIDFVDTYACAYRRAALIDAGGFDERYGVPSTEDQELSFRLHERGAVFVFVPAARTRHLHAATPLSYLRKKARIGTFKVATLRAHPGKAVSDAHTPPGLKLQLFLGPLSVAGAAALVPVASLGPSWAIVAAAPGVAFGLTTFPLALRALARDPVLAPLVPLYALGRALALGWGVARGLVREAGPGVLRPARPAELAGGPRP